MSFDVVPVPSEPDLAAIRRALARAGIRPDGQSEAYSSEWRLAAAREATDNQPAAARFAPSPRSTRGATRA